jgi:toxin ParE1/3/4
MNLILLDEAEAELRDAVIYYEGIEQSLGFRFRDEVSASLAWIRDNPEVLRLRPAGYRRANLRVFPYYISYIIRGDNLWIVAIAHGRRKPLYWIERKKKLF